MGTLLSQDLSSGGGRRLAKKICHAAHRLRSTHRTAPIVCEAPKVPSTHSSYVVFVVGIGWALLLLRTSAIPLQQNLTVLSRLRSICYSCNFFFYCTVACVAPKQQTVCRVCYARFCFESCVSSVTGSETKDMKKTIRGFECCCALLSS